MTPAVLALLSAAMLSAAESNASAPCATVQHEVDFVVGNWLVRDSAGRAVGTATIARAYGGCVLLETWLGVGGAGESLGVIGYQSDRGRWRRDFLEPGGVVLRLEGRIDGPAMVMTGKEYQADGVRMHRVTWTPTRDAGVEERWLTSTDAGRTWQIKFSGVFHRIAE